MKNNLFFVFLISSSVFAQPDPNKVQRINTITVWQDHRQSNVYYYLPGNLELAKEKDGQPAMKLMMLRYIGTVLNKDEDKSRFRSLLQMRVKMNRPSKEELLSVKNTLRAKDLFILPVSRLSSQLILPSPGTLDSTSSEGFFEPSATETANGYWEERNFTLRLDNLTAQYVKAQLDSNRLLMSFAYAFYVNTSVKIDTGRVIGAGLPVSTTTDGALSVSDSSSTVMAKADAVPIRINLLQWPAIVTTIDMNQKMPPAYACVDIYCYDFNNEIRTDLYSKMIQVKAKGVAGDDVLFNVTFNSKAPDIYAASVRFKYAVRVDLPFSYRVTEVSKDGDIKQQEWVIRDNWYQIIDITTQTGQ